MAKSKKSLWLAFKDGKGVVVEAAGTDDAYRKAGVSAYGGAAIPGGDSIISDPMWATEYGGTVQGGYGTRL